MGKIIDISKILSDKDTAKVLMNDEEFNDFLKMDSNQLRTHIFIVHTLMTTQIAGLQDIVNQLINIIACSKALSLSQEALILRLKLLLGEMTDFDLNKLIMFMKNENK